MRIRMNYYTVDVCEQVKDEFQEPRYTWPVLKLLKMFTTSPVNSGNGAETSTDHSEAILDCLNLSKPSSCHSLLSKPQ